jgi:WxcM-like, C-terminal
VNRANASARPSVEDCSIVELSRLGDPRGSLTFVEGLHTIPFDIRRAYWIYDVPGGEERTGHAYRQLEEFIVSLSGSFSVAVDDGASTRSVVLNRSYVGLYIPPLLWRAIHDFSTNGVCLVLASRHYDEDDYLRDYGDFVRARDAFT